MRTEGTVAAGLDEFIGNFSEGIYLYSVRSRILHRQPSEPTWFYSASNPLLEQLMGIDADQPWSLSGDLAEDTPEIMYAPSVGAAFYPFLATGRAAAPPRAIAVFTGRRATGLSGSHSQSLQETATRMALRMPAITVQPYIPESSGIPARDLREWTRLTNHELAELCGVSERSFAAWLNGAQATAEHERLLLMLHYLAHILAGTLGPDGTRRWFRSPHPELDGASPLDAFRAGKQGEVKELAEIHLESPAT